MTQSAQGGRMDEAELLAFRHQVQPKNRLAAVFDMALLALKWEENAKYLLDSTRGAVRSCYRGGPEDLLASICINYIGFRDGRQTNALRSPAAELEAAAKVCDELRAKLIGAGRDVTALELAVFEIRALAQGGQGGECNDQRESAARGNGPAQIDTASGSNPQRSGETNIVRDGARQSDSHPTGQGAQSAAEQEQCSYCGEWYPKPISLHHTTDECRANEAAPAGDPVVQVAEPFTPDELQALNEYAGDPGGERTMGVPFKFMRKTGMNSYLGIFQDERSGNERRKLNASYIVENRIFCADRRSLAQVNAGRGWIATFKDRNPVHFSEEEGWTVEQVLGAASLTSAEAVRLLPGLKLAEAILRQGGFKSANVIERQIAICACALPLPPQAEGAGS